MFVLYYSGINKQVFVFVRAFKMKNKKKSKKSSEKHHFAKFVLCLAVFAAIATAVIAIKGNKATADESLELNKYYTSVTVEAGDTLWSIATEYKKTATSSTKAYIEEIKSINNLSSDDITAGQNLIVVYYAE